jgi:hypothetical protein
MTITKQYFELQGELLEMAIAWKRDVSDPHHERLHATLLENFGTVIDYCLMDVAITAKLIKLVINQGELRSPVTGELIKVRSPFG